MANVRGGVFTLRTLSRLKKDENWFALSDVWINEVRYTDGAISQNIGYFAGGGSPQVSTVDKINFSTDTRLAAIPANLSSTRYKLAATGNSDFGYFAGGQGQFPNGTTSVIDKIQYSNDTRLPSPGVTLSVANVNLAATGNSTAGYFGGGSRSTIEKIQYSNDTRTTLPTTGPTIGSLSAARSYLAATGNSTHGYFGGGFPGPVSTMDKLQYSTDTRLSAIPTANLTAARYTLAATGNSTHGYFGSGGSRSTMDKLTYSSDITAAVPGANLPNVSINNTSATGNGINGYFGGGRSPSPSTSAMFKVDYTSDTIVSVPGAFLSIPRYSVAASSARANALPYIGSQPTPTPATSPILSQISTPNTGYFGGGSPGPVATMDKIDYATDTRLAAIPGANLSAAKSYLAATGNSTHGYFGGGQIAGGNSISTMDRLTYSSDITAALPSTGSLSAARYGVGATGNSTAGYFGGGVGPGVPIASLVEKIQYSNDTRSAAIPTAGFLITGRYRLAATGNSTHGYFGGGRISGGNATSIVDKIEYSTDTRSAALPNLPLSSARYSLAATGNSTAGYFGGGVTPGGSHSTMDKVTYSNDTRALLPATGSLSGIRYNLAATGNSTDGYFGGGRGAGFTSAIEKIQYSNDTRSAEIPANLSTVRERMAAVSARSNALPTSLPGYVQVPNIV